MPSTWGTPINAVRTFTFQIQPAIHPEVQLEYTVTKLNAMIFIRFHDRRNQSSEVLFFYRFSHYYGSTNEAIHLSSWPTGNLDCFWSASFDIRLSGCVFRGLGSQIIVQFWCLVRCLTLLPPRRLFMYLITWTMSKNKLCSMCFCLCIFISDYLLVLNVKAQTFLKVFRDSLRGPKIKRISKCYISKFKEFSKVP